jgi:hypothetical protein
MLCPHCGRETVRTLSASYCLNINCPSTNWRRRTKLNQLELTPSVALNPSASGRFVGSLSSGEIMPC